MVYITIPAIPSCFLAFFSDRMTYTAPQLASCITTTRGSRYGETRGLNSPQSAKGINLLSLGYFSIVMAMDEPTIHCVLAQIVEKQIVYDYYSSDVYMDCSLKSI